MTIRFSDANIFDTECETSVFAVNSIGYPHPRTLAGQARIKYSEAWKDLEADHAMCQIRAGHVAFCRHGDQAVFWMPITQYNSRGPQMIYVKYGLANLVAQCRVHEVESLAIHAIGCGSNGNLDWIDVKSAMVSAFETFPEMRTVIYNPGKRPPLTKPAFKKQRKTPPPVILNYGTERKDNIWYWDDSARLVRGIIRMRPDCLQVGVSIKVCKWPKRPKHIPMELIPPNTWSIPNCSFAGLPRNTIHLAGAPPDVLKTMETYLNGMF